MYQVREMGPGDIGACVRLLEECRGGAEGRALDVAQFVSDTNAGALTVVAHVGRDVVGVVSARTMDTEAWIRTVAISPAWRHQAFGSTMLRLLEDLLLHRGARKLSAILTPFQAGQTALEKREFVATHGLVLFEKVEPVEPSQMRVIDSWGGELVDAAAWDAVAGMAAEKRIIDSRIVAPLADPDTARRVGVNPPAAVMLFGPPGTGKTTFAKAVAGRLGWPFVELLPSKLAGPSDNLAAELRAAMEALTTLDEVVVFIDEFDEIATRRETSPSTRAVVNEVLKSLPIFRARPGRLLVCATNFVTTIDPAVLRPGRFDLLIPIGPPDPEARRALWEAALARLPGASADLGDLVRASERFTPGDVELAAQRAAAAAFEHARAGHSEARVSEDDLHAAIGRTRASITREVAEQFADEAAEFARD